MPTKAWKVCSRCLNIVFNASLFNAIFYNEDSVVTPSRLALIANGSLITGFAASAIFIDSRFFWLLFFMGCSLIFSGWADYCGFARIFQKCMKS